MATIANPVSAFDFAHPNDIPASSYSFDPLNPFSDDLDPRSAMSGFDPNFFQNLFTSEPEQQSSSQAESSSRHHPTTTRPTDFAYATPSTTSYVFGTGSSIASTSSEATSHTMQSTVPSSLSSPEQHFPFGQQLSDFSSSTNTGYLNSTDNSTYGAEPYGADFADYQGLLAGGKQQSGFVGEWHGFPPASSSVEHAGLFPGFSLPSNTAEFEPTPFKKPQAKAASWSSAVSSPADISPSFQQALWQSSTSHPTSARRSSTYPVPNPPTVPSSPQAATSQPQIWVAPGSSMQDQGYVLPEKQVFSSPTPVQDARFQSSPTTQQNHFFQQSSGNYVAPLESSCSFFPISKFRFFLLFFISFLPAAITELITNTQFLDPNLLHQGMLTPTTSIHTSPHNFPHVPPPASPALSQASSHGLSRAGSNRFKSSRSQSPYLQSHQWTPYTKRPPFLPTRGDSVDVEDSEREKNRCPHPECGKIFKDLKAHMLTHQNERPEKCPIPSCEYSKKGFSRKYDKNRHTLTHYKGTMVCGFCPGSGSSAEKSFNRADVFKRHLTTVHGVEQNPPNSRKKPSAAAQARSTQNFGEATGKCSICSGVFSNAQDFYEHLEDCVLNVVQKTDPSEAINEQLLTSVAEDQNVKDSLERNNLPTSLEPPPETYGSGDDEEEDNESGEDNAQEGTSKRRHGTVGSSHVNESGAIAKPGAASRGRAGGRGPGLTYSKGGVPLSRSGRKRRKDYPNSWGCNADKMKMKKRVITAWDGQRRLAKDDMMLSNEFEVRLPMPDAGDGAYVTDLDVQTLRRTEGFFGATEEERGPWDACVTNVPGAGMDLAGLMP